MGDNKTRPHNWCRQFARKVGPSDNYVRYSSVYDSPLDRFAIARERAPSTTKGIELKTNSQTNFF